MNRLLCVLCLLVLVVGFVAFHTHEISVLSHDLEDLSAKVEDAFSRKDWDAVSDGTQQLQSRWENSRFWASLTINTEQIEELEISLRQAKAYADLHAEPDFIGEFLMFQTLARHLPSQEGFDIRELL